jgi:hypothetical protein
MIRSLVILVFISSEVRSQNLILNENVLTDIETKERSSFTDIKLNYCVYINNNTCINCIEELGRFLDSTKPNNYSVVLINSGDYISNLRKYKSVRNFFDSAISFYIVDSNFLSEYNTPIIIKRKKSGFIIVNYRQIFDKSGKLKKGYDC